MGASHRWGICSGQVRVAVKRVALKYCGGCDCTYDRLEYAKKLKKAAEGHIEWVSMDDGGFDTILMIHGCHVACPEELGARSPLANPVGHR